MTTGAAMTDADHAAFEQDFSDYHDRALPPARLQEIEAHLAGCARCRGEYDRFRETLGALSGLHKMAAPQHFEDQVAQTIHRRSAGRFFGRKAFGDRVPFELLAVLALVIGVAVILLVRWSATGSVHEPLRKEPRAPQVAPGAREMVPAP